MSIFEMGDLLLGQKHKKELITILMMIIKLMKLIYKHNEIFKAKAHN